MADGSSSAICRRLSSSRQESPASTRIRVRLLATSVLFPLEPEDSTVILIMRKAYAPWLLILGRLQWRGATRGTPAAHSGNECFSTGRIHAPISVPASPHPPCG